MRRGERERETEGMICNMGAQLESNEGCCSYVVCALTIRPALYCAHIGLFLQLTTHMQNLTYCGCSCFTAKSQNAAAC